MDKFLEQWNKIPRAGRFMIPVVVWIALAAGYYFAFYGDQAQKYSNLKRDFLKQRKKRKKYELIRQNLPRLEKELTRLQKEHRDARKLLPTSKELPALLQKLDLLGKRRLDIKRFRPFKDRPKTFYSEVPISMEVQGTFQDLMNFFNKVSNLDRIVNVTGIQLTSPSFKNQKLLLSAKFRLITYRFRGEKKKRRRKKRS